MSSKLDHFTFYVDKDKFEKVVVSAKGHQAFSPFKAPTQRSRFALTSAFIDSKAWYLAALAPLKYEKIADFGETVGLGVKPSKEEIHGTL